MLVRIDNGLVRHCAGCNRLLRDWADYMVCPNCIAAGKTQCDARTIYWPDDEHVRVRCALLAGHHGPHLDMQGEEFDS